jgi:hypothetical protein
MENQIQEVETMNEKVRNVGKLDKCFFGQKSALKVQYNPEGKAIFLGIGKKGEDDSWTWKTAKLKDTESAEIILVIRGKAETASFYHTFKGGTTRVSINRNNGTIFFRVEDYARALNPGEKEVLRMILEEAILRASMVVPTPRD